MILGRTFYLIMIFLFLIVLISVFIIWQRLAYRADTPHYTILKKDGHIEIRQYPELIVAQVTIKAERYAAINAGFRLLADYIFGNNQPRKKIAMTAPVMQEGVKIAMTAPVIQQMIADNWVVRFVMPADSTLENLPKPNNSAVTLTTLPAKKYVVIGFSGSNTDKNLQKNLQLLLNYIDKHNLTVMGSAVMAFYNPPWILPFWRRNEIMFECH